MSARINNKPIETIELSLHNMEVVQSRWLKNKATKYHDRIINLVKNHIPQIAKLQTF